MISHNEMDNIRIFPFLSIHLQKNCVPLPE
jgi:hypothetical protein